MQGISFLQEQMTSVTEKLSAVEKTLNQLKADDKSIFAASLSASTSTVSSGGLNRLQAWQIELSQTQMEAERTNAQLTAIRNQIAEAGRTLAVSLPPQIEQIQGRLLEKQLQLDSMHENFTEREPALIHL